MLREPWDPLKAPSDSHETPQTGPHWTLDLLVALVNVLWVLKGVPGSLEGHLVMEMSSRVPYFIYPKSPSRAHKPPPEI